MAGKGREKVDVTYENGKLVCSKEWVNLYWETGPDGIQWVFKKVPAKAKRAAVIFHNALPAKYRPVPGFKPRGPFLETGFEPPTGGSHLNDLFAEDLLQERGYFTYDIILYDKDGVIVARSDPGGTLDPTTPPGPHP